MTDLELMALCVLQEAGNQPFDGQAAVALVILNRTRLRFFSDGTIAGTIQRHAQFSWTEYAMVDGKYTRVADGLDAEMTRIQTLLTQTEAQAKTWARTLEIVQAVQDGRYQGADFGQITPNTVMYDNLSLARPPWLHQFRQVCKIGAHTFFEPLNAPVGQASNDPGLTASKQAVA